MTNDFEGVSARVTAAAHEGARALVLASGLLPFTPVADSASFYEVVGELAKVMDGPLTHDDFSEDLLANEKVKAAFSRHDEERTASEMRLQRAAYLLGMAVRQHLQVVVPAVSELAGTPARGDVPGRADHAQLARQRYLSLDDAAAYLRFPSPKAFWQWARRQGLPSCKAGRINLYLRTALEAHVERAQTPAVVIPPRRRLVTRRPKVTRKASR